MTDGTDNLRGRSLKTMVGVESNRIITAPIDELVVDESALDEEQVLQMMDSRQGAAHTTANQIAGNRR